MNNPMSAPKEKTFLNVLGATAGRGVIKKTGERAKFQTEEVCSLTRSKIRLHRRRRRIKRACGCGKRGAAAAAAAADKRERRDGEAAKAAGKYADEDEHGSLWRRATAPRPISM